MASRLPPGPEPARARALRMRSDVAYEGHGVDPHQRPRWLHRASNLFRRVRHGLLANTAAVAGGWRGTQDVRTISLAEAGCSRTSRGLTHHSLH